MIFLLAGRSGVNNLIKIQISKEDGRFKGFLFYTFFRFLIKYAIEYHMRATSNSEIERVVAIFQPPPA